MDVSSVGCGSALTPEVQAQYAIKLIEMAKQSDFVAESIIQDTVEFSAEALARCTEELNQSLENLM